jgi:uncharacterized membrane protein
LSSGGREDTLSGCTGRAVGRAVVLPVATSAALRPSPRARRMTGMAHVKLTEHIKAPTEDVFALFIDVKRWPEFMPSGEILEVTGPLDEVGTRIRSAMQFLGRKMEGWDEVIEVERPHLLKFAAEEPMKYVATYQMTPAGEGSDVVVETDYELPAGFLGHIADRLFIEKAMERQMRHALENFKALVEAKVPVPA